jgi:hypothetical protein
MIVFLRMPTKSITILSNDDSRFMDDVNKLRGLYDPIFIPIISYMNDAVHKPSDVESRFLHLRIDKSDQYRPCDDLIDYINTYGRVQRPVPKVQFPNNCRLSIPPNLNEPVQLELTRSIQEQLILEGSHQGVSPCDLLREIADFFVKIRLIVRSNQDPTQITEQFVKYLHKK